MMRTIFPVLIIVASLGLFFVYTKPTYDKAVAIRKDEAIYNEALDNAKQYRTFQESLSATMKSITPTEVSRITKMLPDTVDNVRLVIDLEKLATKNGLVFKSVEYDAVVAKDAKTQVAGSLPVATPNSEELLPYGLLHFKISLKGPYSNFISFLHDLEGSLRIVDVVSVGFNAPLELDSKTQTVPDYEYSVELKTYWLKN